MRLTVIAPCLNEAENVPVLVKRLDAVRRTLTTPMRVALVDDGSDDSTWDEVSRMASAYPGFVVPVRHAANQGIVRAWQTGLEATDCEVVCLIDADLQNPPEAVSSLLTSFLENPGSLVQGVRTPAWRAKDIRYLASRALNALLNVAFGDDARDSKSGFVLGERAVIASIIDHGGTFRYPQSFIRVAALRAGVSVIEVSTLFMERHAGKSFLDSVGIVRVSLHSVVDVMKGVRRFGRRPTPRAHLGINQSEQIGEAARPRASTQANRGSSGLRWYFRTMPLHGWLIRPAVQKVYDDLSRTQWLSSEEIRNIQDERLSRLLRHAALSVPYYRRVWDVAGVSPLDIRSRDDLHKLPLLSKDEVRANAHFELFSKNVRYRDLHRISTSGSTGEPFVTYADRFQLEMRFATTIRALEWTGWRFGDKQLRLWHQKLGMTPTQALRERLDAAMMRRAFVPAFEMTEQSLEELVGLIERFRPVLIDGYAESFNFLAQYLSSGRQLKYCPRAIMSSAQTLTAQTRKEIEGAFGCRVYDKYGAREFSGIAYQCEESDDFHVMDESYIVEVLRNGQPAAPGETGEVVVTDLNNYSFPLIRYRIGDIAVARAAGRSCTCGRSLSTIGPIQGRTQALVQCANGRWLPGTFFAHFFKDYSHLVRSYQIEQHEKGSFRLRIVRGDFWDWSSQSKVLDALRPYIGTTIVTFEFVNEIPLLRTGKRTPVISSISVDFQHYA